MFSSAFGAYQSDCPVVEIDVSLHVAPPMSPLCKPRPHQKKFYFDNKIIKYKTPYFVTFFAATSPPFVGELRDV